MKNSNLLTDLIALCAKLDDDRKQAATKAYKARPHTYHDEKVLKIHQEMLDQVEALLTNHGHKEQTPSYLIAKRLYQSGWRMWGVTTERRFDGSPLTLCLGEETRVRSGDFEYPSDAWKEIAKELSLDEPDHNDRMRIWALLCELTNEKG